MIFRNEITYDEGLSWFVMHRKRFVCTRATVSLPKKNVLVKFDVLTAVLLMIQVFMDMTLCLWVSSFHVKEL